MAHWSVGKVAATHPRSYAAYDAAYELHLSAGDGERLLTVEFASPSAVACPGWASEAARPFLDRERPPELLTVGRDGAVLVARGPDDPAAAEPSVLVRPGDRTAGGGEPPSGARARSHHHR